ncbi:MAG TPA: GNAT family N-acetyltransferase [Bryobacteraceae bacterium]|nr:GNAT family N-acetyltransferase [Bryobacteraceae bacterium]
MPLPSNTLPASLDAGEESLFAQHWAARSALPLPGQEPGKQFALHLHRFRELVSHPGTQVSRLTAGTSLLGIGCWSPLPWDSQMYGFPAARMDSVLASSAEHLLPLLKMSIASARAAGIRHLIARVDAGDLPYLTALTRLGFELIDGIQTFSLSLPQSLETSPSIATRLYQPADLGQILNLARTAYLFDRFHSDPAIGNDVADRINEEWLRNSCSGQAADAVIVAVEEDSVLGYATCKLDTACRPFLGQSLGTIVMVATAESARRRGVAAACTRAAVDWFQRHGAGLVQVGTQFRNIPAARLYERCGFRIASNSLTWRLLL